MFTLHCREALSGKKALQKLNNGLKSAVKQAKLPADFICYYCSYY